MASKTICFVLLVIALSLVVEYAEAGACVSKKKKKTDNATTTTMPSNVSGEAVGSASVGEANPPAAAGISAGSGNNRPVSSPAGETAKPGGQSPGSPATGTRGAIADPGLATGPRSGSPVNTASGRTPNGNNRQNPPALGARPGFITTTRGISTQRGGQVSPGQGNRPVPANNNPVQPNSQGTGTFGGTQVSTSGQTTSGQPTNSGSEFRSGAAIAGGAAVGAAAEAGGEIYRSNPTYSKGMRVTDEDLYKLSEDLFIKDTNNANRYITLNLQKQTTGSDPVDLALLPLFTVNPEVFNISTIKRVIAVYNKYEVHTGVKENLIWAEKDKGILLINKFLSTNVMAAAMRFLAEKRFMRRDYFEYKDALERLWFSRHSRDGEKIGRDGFRNVFLAELERGTKVIGLHNWIYFNDQEKKNHVKYLGYTKKVDLGDKASILKIHAKYGDDKLVTTMFVGTSPEFEMALYTVCFFARPEGLCSVSLGGTKFNITTKTLRYKGKKFIDTAYPDITGSDDWDV